MKKTVLTLAILLTLAFTVRLVIAFNTYIISSDGPFYLSVAKDFANGDYLLALNKQVFHQLYPFLIAIASKFISNWEWAGMLVSIILSSLGIIPLYFIAKRYFTGTITIIACLLYSFHPQGAQLSAAIFTTGTHISILLFALWVTILALETGINLYFILSGILAFVMYLNRPDGLAFLGITLMGILFVSTGSWKSKGIKAIYLVIPWILLLGPYLFAVDSATGVFGLTGKVSAEAVTDMETTKSFGGLYQFVVDFIKGANPILFLLFLVGAIRAMPGNSAGPVCGPTGTGRRPLFVWLVFAGFMAFFTVYAFTHGRMSKRYTVPLFLMMLPWTAAGIYYLGDLSERMFVRAGKISSRATAKVVSGLVILILIILSVFTFKPVGKDKVIEKNTGELLREYHSARLWVTNLSPVMITTLSRVAYYAGGTNIAPEGWDLSTPYGAQAGKDKLNISDFLLALKDTVRKRGVDYLVLDSRIMRKFPDIENELAKPFMDNISVELISRSFGRPTASDKYYKVYRFISRSAPQENK
jgi:hypothetical protein